MKRKAKPGEALAWARAAARHTGVDCLLWPFGTLGSGYGAVHALGTLMAANRFVCILAHGEPHGQMQAAHSCGNRLCCNAGHLRWATQAENEADKLAHGRDNRGARCGTAKLSPEDVKAIRAERRGGASQKELSRRYGVVQSTVSRITTGKRWAHTTPLKTLIAETRSGLLALETEGTR